MTDVLILDRLPPEIQSAIASGLDLRVMCPKCAGGRTREVSLSVRPVGEGVVKLSCWRVSCGWYGLTMTDPDAKIHSKVLKVATPYEDPIMPLSPRMLDMLVSDYGLSPYEIAKHGWGEGNPGTLVMTVRDPFRREIGHTTRTFSEKKWCSTYKTTAAPWLDWWIHETDEHLPLIVVEDQLSAARAYGCGLDAVALLGTNISVEDAQQIAQFAGDRNNIFLALDRDAFLKSLKLAARHAHIVPFKPICLDNDIKNMNTDEEVRNLFRMTNDRRDSATSGSVQKEASL